MQGSRSHVLRTRDVRAEQIRLLFAHAPAAYSINLVNALALTAFLWPAVPRGHLLTWFAAMAVVTAGRFLLALGYRRSAPPPIEAQRWGRRFLIGAALTACLWGAGGVVLYPPHSVLHQSFLTFLIGGMAAGASLVLAARVEAYLSYVLLIMTPITLWLLVQGDKLHTTMGFMALLFIAMLLESARRSHRTITEAITLRYEQNALLEQLERAVRHGNDLNRELRGEIEERRRIQREIERERNFTNAVLDAAGALMVVLDREGRIRSFNRSCERLTGYAFEEVRGRPVWDLIPADESAAAKQLLSRALEGGAPNQVELHWLTRDGEPRLIAWSNTTLLRLADTGEFIIGSGIDLTERKRRQQELQQLNTRLQTLLHAVPDPYFRLARDSTVLAHTPGRDPEPHLNPRKFLGKRMVDLLPENARAAFTGALHRALTGAEPAPVEYRQATRGAERDYEARFVSLEEGQALMWVRDVSGRKQAERRLAQLARYDALTGLANRVLFDDRLRHALELARRDQTRSALLYLDLDNFKEVNDDLGHAAGDDLLRQVARRLGEAVRESDTVARLGGDEFILLLERIDAVDDAREVAEKVFAALRRPLFVATHRRAVTASMGIALVPDDAREAEALIRCADTAMYRAKRAGRDHYCCYTPCPHPARDGMDR